MARDRQWQTGEERTEEERTRAREERERRRRVRQGVQAPPLPPPIPTALPVPDVAEPAPLVRPARPRPQRHPPHLHRPHLHRPHLPRRVSPARTGAARLGALLVLVLVLAVLGGGAALLIRHADRKAPPPGPRIVKVMIPEGYTEAQIAALAREDGLTGSYSEAVAHAEHAGALRPSSYRAPHGTRSLEGFLFPASYELYAGTPVSQLVSQQLAAFRANFDGTLGGAPSGAKASGEVDRARKLGVSPYDLLIVASIVEREAGIAHDRPLVAAVVYNRLRLGMTLGIDATLRYALHDFEHPLTEAQLATDTPYNTRLHKGLPPTPIANPGAAAIKAAAHPARASYLYYVAGADGCGEQVFSTSYARFLRAASAYSTALRRNGGNVPTCRRR